MKRVVFVLSHFEQGGTLEVMRSLASGLRDRGYQTEMLAIYRGRYAVVGDSQPLLDVARPSALEYFVGAAKLWARMRHIKPDVIISALPIGNLFASIAGAFRKESQMISTHHFPSGAQGRFLCALDHACGRTRLYSSIVCVSDSVAASLSGAAATYRRKIKVIPNAVPRPTQTMSRAQVRAALEVDPGEFLFCAIGRLSIEKNLAAGIDAFSRTSEGRLVVVGDGPQGPLLRRIVEEKGMGHRVIFTGALPHQEALNHLMASDAFAQFSLYEGRSLALLEAFMAGVPTVLSDISSHRSTATDDHGVASLFFNPRAVDNIAAMLSRMACEVNLRAVLSESGMRIALHSSIEAMLDDYIRLIEPERACPVAKQHSPTP